MKKLFFILFFAAAAICVMAQEVEMITLGDPANAIQDELISRDGNKYYFRGQWYNKDLMQEQLYNLNCVPAYRQFKNGNKMARAGWGLFGAGLALDVSGAILTYAVGSEFGPLMSTVGGLCETVSVPLLVVGYCRMHDAVENYNMYAISNSRPRAYWSVNASQNGIGLAYNF